MKSLLIVECVEDQLFFQELLKQQNINADVRFHPFGKENTIMVFSEAISIYDQIGLVVNSDCRFGFSKTKELIDNKIKNRGFDQLTNIRDSGLRSQKGKTKIGVWIMPDNHAEGNLEDFLKTIILNSHDGNWNYAVQQTDNALNSNIGFTAKSHHRSKSEMGAWLAWHDPPRMSFGKALSEGYFDRQHPSYLALVNWLKWVFL